MKNVIIHFYKDKFILTIFFLKVDFLIFKKRLVLLVFLFHLGLKNQLFSLQSLYMRERVKYFRFWVAILIFNFLKFFFIFYFFYLFNQFLILKKILLNFIYWSWNFFKDLYKYFSVLLFKISHELHLYNYLFYFLSKQFC